MGGRCPWLGSTRKNTMRNYEEIMRIINGNPDIFDGLDGKSVLKFMIWFPDNLHVLTAFEQEAKYLKNNGKRERYSAYTIREKLRWDTLLRHNSDDDYKLNNNYSPMVARIVMILNPELEGMFAIRKRYLMTPEELPF